MVLQFLAHGGLALLPKLTPVLLGVSFVLLVAVKIPGIGVDINGARRWIGAGPLQFQPSELMKLALVLHAAAVLATRPERLRTLQGVIGPLLVVVGCAILLIASQPDLGTALVIAFTMFSLLLVAGVPIGLLGRLGGATAVLVLLFALIDPERVSRLTAFINPWADPTDTGLQAVQGQIALGSGGLFGVGIGESVQKVFYLPEAHTDFILAVIGEELGVAGIFGLLLLYGMIGYAGLRTAKAASTRYLQLLAAGLTAMILCQALLNVFAVLGIAPITGVPLPFISSGGTSLIVLLAAMGLLLNIAARSTSHLRVAAPAAGRAGRCARIWPCGLLIAAGGTAGHVVPALAVAERLTAAGAEVVLVGGERAEAQLVPAAGYELRTIRVAGLSRTNPLRAARAAGLAAAAVGHGAAGCSRELRPDVVLGGGGYVAGPVGLAALARRIPLVLTEADSHLGITNRLLAPRARRVCLAFPIEGREGERYLVTGRPVAPPATDRAAARARFSIGDGETCVLVFGGSLGARQINEAAIEAFAAAPFRVLHAAGTRDYDALAPRVAGRALRPAPLHRRLRRGACGERPVRRARGRLDLRDRRGGPAGDARALSARERRPPDRQRALDGRRRARPSSCPTSELTAARLGQEVDALLADPQRLAAMAAASAALARPDAAQVVADELLAAARAGSASR